MSGDSKLEPQPHDLPELFLDGGVFRVHERADVQAVEYRVFVPEVVNHPAVSPYICASGSAPDS
jgi:hypothetical protein